MSDADDITFKIRQYIPERIREMAKLVKIQMISWCNHIFTNMINE